VCSLPQPCETTITRHANAGWQTKRNSEQPSAAPHGETEELCRTTRKALDESLDNSLAPAEIAGTTVALFSSLGVVFPACPPRTGKAATQPLHAEGKTVRCLNDAGAPDVRRVRMCVQVRLTKKLAQVINGIDLSDRRVGDVVELPTHDAEILLAEGWASPVGSAFGAGTRRIDAHDRPRRSTKKRPR